MSITEKVANEASDGLEAEKHDSNKFEDLPKDSSGEEVVPKELLDFYLPVEVWVHAWSFLDFNTRQKICTLVSKTWLNQIRNSSILSGEMKISTSDTNYFEEFEISDAVLLRWKKLKVLHVKSEKEIQRFGNFSQHKLLEKIVVWNEYAPRNQNLNLKPKPFEELGSWGIAKKSWFNPKHPLNPATLENVVAIAIQIEHIEHIPPNFEMEQMAQRMKNLEDLQIRGDLRAEIGFISSFKNLKNVYFNYSIRLQVLIATLNYIASLNLKISGWIDVHDYGSHEQQRNIFEEAVPILNEKFPGKCESLEIDGDDMSIRFDGNIAVLEEDFYNPDVDDEDLRSSASYDYGNDYYRELEEDFYDNPSSDDNYIDDYYGDD